jgi:protein-S-isoprenylcysteine O-methyltransferase Ste14
VESAAPPRDTPGIAIPPPLLYVAGFLAGVGLEIAFPIDGPATWLRVAGGVVGVGAWLALDGAAMVWFRRAGTSMIPFNPTTALVTSGPYRFTRNPMYVGMALLYAGLALALGVVWALIALPAVILVVDRLVIAREEPYLERKFGSEYTGYKARVRRWV